MIVDENVEHVRQVREKLIAKYGGLQGWIGHLQARENDSRHQQHATKRMPVGKATFKTASSTSPRSVPRKRK